MTKIPAPQELYEVMRKFYDELIAFSATAGFRSVLEELYALPEEDRPHYVNSVIMNKNELRARGVVPPEGILILRSSFGDRRPTLFCIKKYLPERYQVFWENVNITFDNAFEQDAVARDETAWRKPLPIDVQSLLLTQGVTAGELGVE